MILPVSSDSSSLPSPNCESSPPDSSAWGGGGGGVSTPTVGGGPSPLLCRLPFALSGRLPYSLRLRPASGSGGCGSGACSIARPLGGT
eukprot:2232709-Pleurochrysis_carterae.AAC.2